MRESYIYHKPVRKPRYANFRRYLFFTIILAAVIVGIAIYIITGLHGNKKSPKSPITFSQVTDNKTTFTGPYFKFQDSGKWVFVKGSSTTNKFVYQKYDGQVIEGQLNIYVNQVPIPLYLAVSRALPVRIVNNNSFQVTGVSDPCGNQYAKGALHRVMDVSVNDATMLCDPDSPQYNVVLAEIGGNYQLHLKLSNGTPMQFIILYLNQDLNPDSGSIINIASSFQTL